MTEWLPTVRRVAGELATSLHQARLDRDGLDGDAEALARCIEDSLLPRLTAEAGPLLVVVGGSTGVGKSTLVNALVGRPVSAVGVLRPTTRTPVLVVHPEDAETLATGRRLPSVEVDLVTDRGVPPGIALLDSPDVDSVVVENRVLARHLLDCADLWLVVTSASRYADDVPWGLLRRVVRRKMPTAVVLNRVPALAVGEVSTHLATLMQAEGMSDSPLLVVAEQEDQAETVPAESVAGIRNLMLALSGQHELRRMVRQASLAGAVTDVAERASRIADDHDLEHLRSVALSLAGYGEWS